MLVQSYAELRDGVGAQVAFSPLKQVGMFILGDVKVKIELKVNLF